MRTFIPAVAVACACASAFAQTPAAPVTIHQPFMSADRYRSFPELMRRAYVVGVVDGMLFSPALAFRDLTSVKKLGACLETARFTDEQLAAIVDRYLADDPARWSNYMNASVLAAVSGACQRLGMPIQ